MQGCVSFLVSGSTFLDDDDDDDNNNTKLIIITIIIIKAREPWKNMYLL